VGRATSVLTSRRVAAFAVAGAAVVTWFVVAPHLGRLSLWPAILLVSLVVIPGTLLLALIALPLWREGWLFAAAIALALVAFGCSEAGWGLPANFAKLWAAIFAGWAFLRLFEELSWVVIVALVIPLVDIVSVWRGPTHSITQHHFALFLAAALRWHLRVAWTWLATTGMYAVTVIVATAAHVGGLPALPFLSFGFLAANADLLWRRLRGTPANPS
jgi:hypothetical protein